MAAPRDHDVLVDNGVANNGVGADVDIVEQNRPLYDGAGLDSNSRGKHRILNGCAGDDATLTDHRVSQLPGSDLAVSDNLGRRQGAE